MFVITLSYFYIVQDDMYQKLCEELCASDRADEWKKEGPANAK